MDSTSTRQLVALAGPSNRLRYEPSWLRRYGSTSGADEQIKRAEMDVFTRLVSRSPRDPDRTQRPGGMLDVGTCTGRYPSWALRTGYFPVCGLDVSAAAVRHCVNDPALRGAHFVHGNILDEHTPARLQADGRRFALATMMLGTVNHFTGADQQRALSQVHRCLIRDGALVVSSWLPGALCFNLYGPQARRFLEERTKDLPALTALVETAGFEPLDSESTECHQLVLARRLT